MCPIFKNVDIPCEAIGEHMQNFVIANRLSQKPRRSLIGSMFGNNIMLTTPLLRWYIEHGLQVTDVYEVVEYIPKKVFRVLPIALAMRDVKEIGTEPKRLSRKQRNCTVTPAMAPALQTKKST
jgi:hypothetical protein